MRRVSRRAAALVLLSLVAPGFGVLHGPSASAHGGCERTVIFTLPGVTWKQVETWRPPELLATASTGAMGSMSVRTNTSHTTYASGFASIGAGARVDGGQSTGGSIIPQEQGTLFSRAKAAGVDEMRTLLDAAGYTTVEPGALADALFPNPVAAIGNSDSGLEPPVSVGESRWALLTAMDSAGNVDLAATSSDLLVTADAPWGVRIDADQMKKAIDRALHVPCITIVVDPGDLTRYDELATIEQRPSSEQGKEALLAADELLGHVRDRLRRDELLIVVSPTSPGWDEEVHFGVAVAWGAGFSPGTLLESPSTRRAGVVTLPDIAPTILQSRGVPRPPSMLGRAMFARASSIDRLAAAVALDDEAVFVDSMRTPVSTAFVVIQVLLYALVGLLLWRRGRKQEAAVNSGVDRWLALGALAVVAFPVCTYLVGLWHQSSLGTVRLVALLLVMDAVVVALASFAFRTPFERLLAVTGFTCAVLVMDLITGANLQFSTLFSYSPLVAGRFYGIGNTAYSVLAAAVVITGSLIVHLRGGSARALATVGVLFTAIVIVDGAPTFGSDVGGILALVPGLGATWFLLGERKPNLKIVLLLSGAVVLALAVFLAVDLAQPEASRTHLARLFEDVRARGGAVFVDVLQRKIQTNLRVFRTTIWTYLVPPALALIALLLVRPRNRWQRVAERYPRLRAGLIGGLILAVLGFALNDSGIVVPAMMLAFFVPLALLMHLSLEHDEP